MSIEDRIREYEAQKHQLFRTNPIASKNDCIGQTDQGKCSMLTTKCPGYKKCRFYKTAEQYARSVAHAEARCLEKGITFGECVQGVR